jgi:tRNA(Glu) U13 pseudouridine synthase TruD
MAAGALKSLARDFVVTEKLRSVQALLARPGPYALVRLRKADVNTATAAAELARALGVAPARVQPAGLKDRRAFTTQYVTVDLRSASAAADVRRPAMRDDDHDDHDDHDGGGLAGGAAALTAPAAPAETAAAQQRLGTATTWGTAQWRAQLVGWTDRHVTGQDLRGNAFDLTLRRLTPAANAELDRRVRLLANPPSLSVAAAAAATDAESEDENEDDDGGDAKGADAARLGQLPLPSRSARPLLLRFVNYFGPQRFGGVRHGLGMHNTRQKDPAHPDVGRTSLPLSLAPLGSTTRAHGTGGRGRIGFSAPALVRGEFEEAVRREIAVATAYDTRLERASRQYVAAHWGQWAACGAGLPAGSPFRAAVAALARPGATFRDAFLALPPVPRSMAVLAFQSHLWNQLTVRYLQALLRPGRPFAAAAPGAPVLWATVPVTKLEVCTPTSATLTALQRRPYAAAASLLAPTSAMPLLGPGTLLSASVIPQPVGDLPDVAVLVAALLREHGLADAGLEGLRIPGVRRPHFAPGTRPWLAAARHVVLGEPVPDDRAPAHKQTHAHHPPLLMRRIAFELPPGAYATVLMSFLLPGA